MSSIEHTGAIEPDNLAVQPTPRTVDQRSVTRYRVRDRVLAGCEPGRWTVHSQAAYRRTPPPPFGCAPGRSLARGSPASLASSCAGSC